MKVTLLGDKDFSGFLKCSFQKDENDIYYLNFDLGKWVSIQENGIIGGDYFETYRPKPLKMTFDTPYEVSIEDAREIYKTLYMNGWR